MDIIVMLLLLAIKMDNSACISNSAESEKSASLTKKLVVIYGLNV